MHAEIKRVYEEWKNALVKTDLITLEKIYTDNFLWTNSIGITFNKEQHLFKVSSGNVKYISWVDEDMKIDITADKATVKTKEVLALIVYEQRINITRNVTANFELRSSDWLISEIEEQKNII